MSGHTLEEALAHGRGTERPFCCPVHEDHNASASVNVAKGVWVCHACGASGTIEGHCPSPQDAIAILKGAAPPRVYPESWLEMYTAAGPSPYWADRFGAELALHFGCGTDPVTGMPTYPIRNIYGDLLGVVKRTDGKPKYLYPFGVQISSTFFTASKEPMLAAQNKLHFVLVEGAADVMAVVEAGLPWDWMVLGCFGAGLHLPQVEAIRDMSPARIITAFDDDEAGRRATLRAVEALDGIAPVLVHHWGAKDPGELPVATRNVRLLKARSMSLGSSRSTT